MEKSKKKIYEKPKLNKIKLDPQCAVLGFCKNLNTIGPRMTQCGFPFTCMASGSWKDLWALTQFTEAQRFPTKEWVLRLRSRSYALDRCAWGAGASPPWGKRQKLASSEAILKAEGRSSSAAIIW